MQMLLQQIFWLHPVNRQSQQRTIAACHGAENEPSIMFDSLQRTNNRL
jgi:hypothetical protein